MDVERCVLPENRLFQLLHALTRLEPEVFTEEVPRLPVDLEGIGLSTRSVQREHQLLSETLLKWVFGDEPFELADQLCVMPEGEIGVESRDQTRQPQLLETPRHGWDEFEQRKITENGAPIERERFAQLG